MKNTNLKILKLLITADLLLAGVSLIFFDIKTLWNTQIGFISATLVMIASMISYRRMVNTRVENEVITTDIDKDVIDKLEDPYDLYSEEIKAEESDEKEFAEVVKEEKKKLKENKRTLFQVLKDTKAALSIYRLGAYAVLILGFLYLHRHGLLHMPSYVIALGLPPVIIVTILIRNKSQDAVE
ncbi:hypothetical protein YH65_04600 [Sulfurovum lithotrophicum]|uniref:Uncharacterized protein n=1 Tax=Sulfurovum lithotrophicum TaxID=206403 RepID=A0A7U4M0R0_9BACT|nr:hypothetical protein [Sulfurovum lithotrophicum]AKF24745.1 hypothetical protein YH65_04600 [Sulfurovum lithotrophicum]